MYPIIAEKRPAGKAVFTLFLLKKRRAGSKMERNTREKGEDP